jgi:hypothetical protein
MAVGSGLLVSKVKQEHTGYGQVTLWQERHNDVGSQNNSKKKCTNNH